MRKIPELLVPAGGMKQLKAAIANGADAVYLSGNAFNARLNAENFTQDELQEAIDLAHEYGVKVHIAQNTLINTDEMKAAVENALLMYKYGADALILQDRGLASELKRIIPDMPLHMSTQGTVYDTDGVREAADAGFSRIILSRELSHKEIAGICKIAKNELNKEIEIFVHGAICICYSGQCHLSHFIGGRSGNRGSCAQPCRLPYMLLCNGRKAARADYPLSPADMCLLKHLDEITSIGVTSLKIEGRMKSPEYVAIVTSRYRKYLDCIARGDEHEVMEKDIDDLRQIFSRGRFTDSYYIGESGRKLMSDKFSKHQGISIGELISIDKKRCHAIIKLHEGLSNGDGIEIHSCIGRGRMTGKKSPEPIGGVVTYINEIKNDSFKDKKNPGKKTRSALIKSAEKGMLVEVGDLHGLARADTEFFCRGAQVFKISSILLNNEAKASYTKLPQCVDVDFDFTGRSGEYAELCAYDSDLKNNAVTVVSSQPLEKAINKPTSKETITDRLKKTGGTPYKAHVRNVNIEDNLIISAAELNLMRRQALEKLTEKRVMGAHRECPENAGIKNVSDIHLSEKNGLKPSVTLNIYMADHSDDSTAKRIVNLMDMLVRCHLSIYKGDLRSFSNDESIHSRLRLNIPYKTAIDALVIKKAEETGIKLTACLPVISKPAYTGEDVISDNDIKTMLHLCQAGALYGISIANPSQLVFFERAAEKNKLTKPRLFFEESMNIYNAYTAIYAHSRGMTRGLVSHELNPADMFSFGDASGLCEFSVWGRVPLMHTEHCPIGSSMGAGDSCSENSKKHYCRLGHYELMDRKGERYPLIPDDKTCRCTLMSYRRIDHINEIPTLQKSGIAAFRINIFDEGEDEISDILSNVLSRIK